MDTDENESGNSKGGSRWSKWRRLKLRMKKRILREEQASCQQSKKKCVELNTDAVSSSEVACPTVECVPKSPHPQCMNQQQPIGASAASFKTYCANETLRDAKHSLPTSSGASCSETGNVNIKDGTMAVHNRDKMPESSYTVSCIPSDISSTTSSDQAHISDALSDISETDMQIAMLEGEPASDDENEDPDDPDGEGEPHVPEGDNDPDDPDGEEEPEEPEDENDPDDPDGEGEPQDPEGDNDPDDPDGEGEPQDPEGDNDPDDPDGDGEPGGPVHNEDDDDEDGINFGFDDPSLNFILRFVHNITVREVFVLVLSLAIRYSLTYDCIVDIFKVLNVILGRKYFPESKDKLWSQLQRNGSGIKKHYYCPQCQRMIQNFDQRPAQFRCVCGLMIVKKRAGIFMQLSIYKQLKHLLEKRDFFPQLQYREHRQKNVEANIEDILDGSYYRSLQEPNQLLSNANNFSYTFNTDGFKTTTTSRAEAWPIFLRLNELPPILRQKFILLGGIWVDRKHPPMNSFLAPFVVEANRLSSVGVTWTLNGEDVTSRFVPLCCTADAKGRCALLNLNEPTGYFSCQFCDHQGVPAGGAPKFPLWPHEDYPDLPQPLPRTHDSICDDMVHANNGFKGASELLLLDHFDLKDSFSTDDLHPLFLGVVKDYFAEMFDFGNLCYIGAPETLIQIDRRRMALKTPTSISRKARPMNTWKKWRGTEFRNFLFYELPCLIGILPERFLNHLLHLSNAAHLLSQESISEGDLGHAEDSLTEFMTEFQELFGVEKMKFNSHMLLHLVEVVRKLGNLWAHSTFNFESWNHRLGKFITSSNGACDQVVNRLLMAFFVSASQYDDRISQRVQTHVGVILSPNRLDNAHRVGDVYLLGKAIQRAATAEEARQLQLHGIEIVYVTEYKRAFHKNIEFRSSAYNVEGRIDNSNIFTWNGMRAYIVSILLVRNAAGDEVCGMFCEVYNDVTPNEIAQFIVRVNAGVKPFDWVIFSDVRSLLVKIVSGDDIFLARMPNHVEID